MFFCQTMLRLWPVMGWGGVGMLTFLELAHILDAMQLRSSCAHKHAWSHATCANKHACVFLVKHAWCYGSHGVGWGGVSKNLLKENHGFTKPCKYQPKIHLCCPALQIVWKMNRGVSCLTSKNVTIPTNQVDRCGKKGGFRKGSLTTP